MRRLAIWAMLFSVLSLVGCGAPDSKPPAGAESSDTKLDIEEGGGEEKPASDAPMGEPPAAGEAAKP
jgi:hypothetical protein